MAHSTKIIEEVPMGTTTDQLLVWNQTKKQYETSLTAPVFMTQAEYDALTEDQQKQMWVIITG